MSSVDAARPALAARRLAHNTIIESTFDVGRRFRCTMRVDCGQLDPDWSSGWYLANGIRTSQSTLIEKSSPIGVPAATQSIGSPH